MASIFKSHLPVFVTAIIAAQRALAQKSIDEKYKSLGAEAGMLGNPSGTMKSVSSPIGAVQKYAEGAIYWSPDTGAHILGGEISSAYDNDALRTTIGFPTSDQQNAPGSQESSVGFFLHGLIVHLKGLSTTVVDVKDWAVDLAHTGVVLNMSGGPLVCKPEHTSTTNLVTVQNEKYELVDGCTINGAVFKIPGSTVCIVTDGVHLPLCFGATQTHLVDVTDVGANFDTHSDVNWTPLCNVAKARLQELNPPAPPAGPSGPGGSGPGIHPGHPGGPGSPDTPGSGPPSAPPDENPPVQMPPMTIHPPGSGPNQPQEPEGPGEEHEGPGGE